ncbi:hypothetical protein Pmani_034435 [Petrolisthes manimaculis]|uniref:Uncharacterized protein n=1 Tax=Petrolisthes manimaculis TaxID=1843537 RepID=A0AAE1NPD2_9EUCA|nr:hypothetical protein Pmani_034435 [Petrolisthes manimaculis]
MDAPRASIWMPKGRVSSGRVVLGGEGEGHKDTREGPSGNDPQIPGVLERNQLERKPPMTNYTPAALWR